MSKPNKDLEAEVIKKAASKYADSIIEKANNRMAARDLESIEEEYMAG